MSEPEDDIPDAIDRVLDLSAGYVKRVDQVLVDISKDPDAQSETDYLSAIVVALVTHANCYVKVLTARGAPAMHMEALNRIASALSDQIYDEYESEYVTGRINAKGPEEPA
jgi:hypothetical protein